ncbi:MAG: OB-fold domain-containing protein [Acetobacteraceae bacterium]|nr:OB-fold domain-containing protein [Acetobacteraceae bacterium]
MPDPTFAAPPANPESSAFYQAAEQGRFLVPRCTACGRAHWYPRAQCPFCFGPVTLEPASGKGVVYSFSVMRRATPVTTIAYVTLEEGPTMLTSLVDCDVDAIRIGQAVNLVWKATEGGPPLPCFSIGSA